MKKYILLLLLLTGFAQAQTLQNPTYGNTTTNTLKIKTPATSTTALEVGVLEPDGVLNKMTPTNLPIPYVPLNYSVLTPTLGGHYAGIDNKLGTIVATTAGVTTRVWFTADQTTIVAGTFNLTNALNKGATASDTPTQSVTNGDNQKQYIGRDLIGIPFATATIFPAGVYAGNLSASTSPNSAQQRWTVELYKCDNNGTPIASGITGAPVGSLGVTVITILDSGLLTLVDGSVTNVPVSGNLASPLSVAVDERIRYHVSAEKVGTAGANITQSVYYGSSYNSYLDVPISSRASTTVNDSGVVGANVADALNTLNTDKVGGTGTNGQVSFWSGTNTQTGGSGLTWNNTTKTLTLLKGDIYGGADYLLNGSDSNNSLIRTDAVFKAGRIATPHYLSAQPPVANLTMGSGSSSNDIGIGGGTSALNAVNNISFYTAVNNTTLMGTIQGRVFPSGNWMFQTGGTFTDDGYKVSIQGTTKIQNTIDIYGGGQVSLFGSNDSNASIRTNATNKDARIATPHYLSAEEPSAIIMSSNMAASNEVRIGGGSSLMNAVTDIVFYTAVNNTTTTGTVKGKVFPSGNWRFQNGGTFTDSGQRLQVDGTTLLNSTVTLGAIPTTSTGTPNILTQPTAGGNIEKIPYTTFAPNLLTGYASGAGTVSGTDTVLQGIQKLNGNNALKADIASPTFTGDPKAPTPVNPTSIANKAYVDAIGSRTISKVVADSSPVTGTTADTVLYTVTIPANTFVTGDVITIRTRIRKTGTAGVVSHRIDGALNAFFQTSNLVTDMERVYVVKSSTLTETNYSVATSSDTSTGGDASGQTYSTDWTVSQNITIGLNNNSTADSSVISFYEITRSR